MEQLENLPFVSKEKVLAATGYESFLTETLSVEDPESLETLTEAANFCATLENFPEMFQCQSFSAELKVQPKLAFSASKDV